MFYHLEQSGPTVPFWLKLTLRSTFVHCKFNLAYRDLYLAFETLHRLSSSILEVPKKSTAYSSTSGFTKESFDRTRSDTFGGSFDLNLEDERTPVSRQGSFLFSLLFNDHFIFSSLIF